MEQPLEFSCKPFVCMSGQQHLAVKASQMKVFRTDQLEIGCMFLMTHASLQRNEINFRGQTTRSYLLVLEGVWCWANSSKLHHRRHHVYASVQRAFLNGGYCVTPAPLFSAM